MKIDWTDAMDQTLRTEWSRGAIPQSELCIQLRVSEHQMRSRSIALGLGAYRRSSGAIIAQVKQAERLVMPVPDRPRGYSADEIAWAKANRKTPADMAIPMKDEAALVAALAGVGE